jgi:hypothetical protein
MRRAALMMIRKVGVIRIVIDINDLDMADK